MGFTDSLRGIMEELEDAKGVALVGMDGIIVEEQKRELS